MKNLFFIILCGWIVLGFIACAPDEPNKDNTDDSNNVDIAELDFNGHDYVDLGLSSGTIWATCNVGADKPEVFGDYFAWGETESKVENEYFSNYSWSSYKYCEGTYETLTKYCTNGAYGRIDGKDILETIDDAVAVLWGGDWRTPTTSEIQELIDECKWEWVADYNGTGIAGCVVSSKKKGNTSAIFLPAAGYRYDFGIYDEGYGAFYWASKTHEEHSCHAYYLYFDADIANVSYYYRAHGRSLRPVCSAQ